MSRRILALCAALTALLAVPASASATTFTVDQAAAAGCSGTTCKTIKDALAAVQDGDTVALSASTTPYLEDPLTVSKKNVTISAVPGTAVVSGKATNAAGSHVITLAGEGDVLSGVNLVYVDLFVFLANKERLPLPCTTLLSLPSRSIPLC
jgi:hypothetical protein